VRSLEIAAKKVPFRHWRRPAVIDTTPILMRTHGVSTLSIHEGLIVPKFKADLAKGVLTSGDRCVAPTSTVEPEGAGNRRHGPVTERAAILRVFA
jgi:hypothetical protein